MWRKRKEHLVSDMEQELFKKLMEIQQELKFARYCFEYATDDALIDCYIYTIKALNKEYEYFLKEAKLQGLTFLGEKIG